MSPQGKPERTITNRKRERQMITIALAAQLTVYAVMLLVGLAVVFADLSLLIAMTVLVLLAVAGCAVVLNFWPFGYRDETLNFSRLLASLAMVVAVLELERTGMLGEFNWLVHDGDIDMYGKRLILHWAAAIVVTLVLVLVALFVRQMVREPRTHLIMSLSTGLVASIVTLGGASWTFLPVAVSQSMRRSYGVWLLAALIVVMLISVASTVMWIQGAHWGNDPASMNSLDAIGQALGRGIAMAMMSGYATYVVAASTLAIDALV